MCTLCCTVSILALIDISIFLCFCLPT
uniref:Uncharacterized protein n=1 Tax=Arundo donax TaxID=35708 RepID=A0A0A8ZD44_ARUDO